MSFSQLTPAVYVRTLVGAYLPPGLPTADTLPMARLDDLDARWLAEARARARSGQWERDSEAIAAALAARHTDANRATGGPRCPTCNERPALVPYRRPESTLPSPAWACHRCGGAWLPDALVAAGLDPRDLPPAAAASPLPPTEATEPAGPRHPCPACSLPMERLPAGPVWLDRCHPCRATWFEPGELHAVYRAHPTPPPEGHDESPNLSDQLGPALFDLALTAIAAWFRLPRL